jgi:signal transduction histidine kinase
MEYFQKDLPQGYSEHLILKVLDPNRIIELNIVKLDDESQVLFLFKEVSVYNRLSKARTTEKFSNILINSIAHNLFTPLNALIQLTKSMSDIIVGVNQIAEKNVQMIGICLQQLVFTTHNILEMSKIRQGRFKQNTKPVNISEKLDCIFDFFKDDMKFREIDHEVKCEDQVKNFMIILDDPRFSIVLYNLLSNGVKHTNGGHIKVSVKILN